MPDNKQLILTYGVLDGRQRTVALSLARVNLALALFAGIVASSLASAGYLLFAGFKTEATAVATVSAPAPVCPEPKAQPIPVCEAPVESSQPVAVAEPPKADMPQTEAAPVVAAAESTPAAPALEALLEDYRATVAGDELTARFAVKNLSNGTLRGKIVAEADFVLPDGTVRKVAAEELFKARWRSTKQLSFKAPGEGKFGEVRITVQDQASQRSIVFFK